MPSPLADQVHSPDDIKYLNMLIYGHPGAGKTFLAGTAQDHPMTSPVLFLDVEGGTTTLRGKDIDIIQVRSPEHIKEIHDKLREDNAGYYKTVVIDSLTELQKLDMRAIMEAQYRKRPDTTDIDVPSQREWGKSNEHIRRIVRAFRDLEMNTIFTALMVDYKDEKTGQITFYPSVPGKLKAEVPGFLDIVGYLYVNINGEEANRVIQFTQTQRVIAKDRTSCLGNSMENPSVPRMWNLIHPNKKKGT